MIDNEVKEFYYQFFEYLDRLHPRSRWVNNCRLMAIAMPMPTDEEKWYLDGDDFKSLLSEYLNTNNH